jgi:hypothetical protein
MSNNPNGKSQYNPNSYHAGVLLILILGAAGIFILPWHVPLTHPYFSTSYVYGFNNRVAQVSTAGCLFALFLLNLWRGRPGSPLVNDAIRGTLDLSNAERYDSRLFASFVAASVLTAVILTAWYCYIPCSRFGEMACFLSRMDLLIMGRVAYYQFPFAYGPAMIYPAYFLYKVLNGWLSVEQAYFVSLLVQWTLGFYLLYYCIRLLFPARGRLLVFWLIAATLFNFSLGANYTTLRFLLPLSSLLWVHSQMMRPSVGAGGICVAAFLGPFGSFLVSPEVGLAATLALVVYFAALLRTSGRRHLWIALVSIFGMVAAVAPWSSRYIAILSRNPGEFPVLPGPGMLLMLGAAFLVIPSVAAWAVRDEDIAGAAGFALCAELGLLIVPAMSRCDTGHVYIYGIGIFLLGMAILARLPGRWCAISAWTLFLVFGVIAGWPHLPWLFNQARIARAGLRAAPAGDESSTGSGFHFSKPFPPRTGMEPLLQYGALAVPLGCEENVERFLKLNGRYAAGYYPSYEPDVYSLPQTLSQIESLDGQETILVPKEALDPPTLSPAQLAAFDSRQLFHLELFPVRLRPRNPPFDPNALLVEAVKRKFVAIGRFGDDYIMRNKAVR